MIDVINIARLCIIKILKKNILCIIVVNIIIFYDKKKL